MTTMYVNSMVIVRNNSWKLVNEKWLVQADVNLEGVGSESVKLGWFYWWGICLKRFYQHEASNFLGEPVKSFSFSCPIVTKLNINDIGLIIYVISLLNYFTEFFNWAELEIKHIREGEGVCISHVCVYLHTMYMYSLSQLII